jgi:hypothetical protein
MRLIALFAALLVAGLASPAVSAQEMQTAIEPSLIPIESLIAVHKAASLCSTCSIQDFFPLVWEDGTVDPDLVVFWPRGHQGTFLLTQDAGTAMYTMGADADVSFAIMGEVTTFRAIISPGGEVIRLARALIELPFIDAPDNAGFCNICGNEEFLPQIYPIGVRIASYFADGTQDMTIPNGFAVLAWYDDDLRLFYGPGTISDLPAAHMWMQIHTVG